MFCSFLTTEETTDFSQGSSKEDFCCYLQSFMCLCPGLDMHVDVHKSASAAEKLGHRTEQALVTRDVTVIVSKAAKKEALRSRWVAKRQLNRNCG